MAISTARRNFRIMLGIMLIMSFSFAAVSSYFYISVKQRKISIVEITPALFQIDIYSHYAKSVFQDQEGKYKTANTLYQKGFFSNQYRLAGMDMIKTLADDGHAPSQVFQGDILLYLGQGPNDVEEAKSYYQAAAKQNYHPAYEKLSKLKHIDKK